MTLYIAEAVVEDDPFDGEGSIIVDAETSREARLLAREGLRQAYYDIAGGWSSHPIVNVLSVRKLKPKPGVVLAKVWSNR